MKSKNKLPSILNSTRRSKFETNYTTLPSINSTRNKNSDIFRSNELIKASLYNKGNIIHKIKYLDGQSQSKKRHKRKNRSKNNNKRIRNKIQ